MSKAMHNAAVLVKTTLDAIEVSQIVSIVTAKNGISDVISELRNARSP